MLTVAAISLTPKAFRLSIAVLWVNVIPPTLNDFREVVVYYIMDVM